MADAKVHKGFYAIWTSIRESVFENLENAFKACGPECTSIAVVGHSLGGALSTLAVLEVITAYPDMKCMPIVAAGDECAEACSVCDDDRKPPCRQPSLCCALQHCGSSARWDGLLCVMGWQVPDTQRLVSNDDEVPHLPPKIFGFSHVAHEVWERTAIGEITYTVCDGGVSVRWWSRL
jgi:hypothetical protein